MSQTPVLLYVAATALLPLQAFALQPQRLRANAPLQAPHVARCSGQKHLQLLSVESTNSGGGIFFDGFSHVSCDIDVSPPSVRINFKTEKPMEPRLCFDFCRTQASAKFFGLVHGRDCYCTTYFHAQSTGGQGMCDAPCEGDTTQMCGGMEKSSLFEMHMCGNSADEAQLAQDSSAKALGVASEVKEASDFLVQQLQDVAMSYKPQVCQLKPEGVRVCAVTQAWLATAVDLRSAAAKLGQTAEVLNRTSLELASHQDEVVPAENTTGAAASGLELTTAAVDRQASKLEALAGVTRMGLARVNGPLAEDKLKTMTGEQRQTVTGVFKKLAHVDGSWNGVCALAQIPGEAYAAVAEEEDWAGCARRCLELSTGTGACVAFNFQFRRGGPGKESDSGKRLAACQLLKEDGLVEPSTGKAVPVFEIAEDMKHDSFDLESLACYAKDGWMAGHKSGPLGTHVVRRV